MTAWPFSGRTRRALTLLAVCSVGVAVALAGCTRDPADPSTDPSPSPSSPPAAPGEYLPGRAAEVSLPERPAPDAPVVLLVPGGSWETADFSAMVPLAEALADAGVVAVSASYRALDDGVGFPQTVDDVACATRFAAQQARAAGVQTQAVTILGHSAGGHLAALVALASPGEFGAGCPYPPVPIAGLVGLAGVYDIAAPPGIWPQFLGATQQEDPELWTRASPVGRLKAGQSAAGLPVLLLHGDADGVVPVKQSRKFDTALRKAGAWSDLNVVPGVDHELVIDPEVAAGPVLAWLG